MIVSIAWLKTLCAFEATHEEVAATLTSRGLTVDSISNALDDTALEVDIPANRPDCLGHLGIARELSAAFGIPLRSASAAYEESGPATNTRVRVIINEPELCARYSARIVTGVRVGPSPPWVTRRLEACGLRPINNVVDASNLVLLELGHPIHTFDLARVADATIRVRRATPGERLVTLDGVDRTLADSMLVIADTRHALGVAGVMGGASSQITDSTRDVLVEAAWFLPRSVRATRRALALPTDASHRFERGVDPEAVLAAQQRAVALLSELAGGTPLPGVVDEWPTRQEPRTIEVAYARIQSLLGYAPTVKEVQDALVPTGLRPVGSGESAVRITVPSWRVDLDRDADVVEEIARHLGYDRIPSRLPRAGAAVPARDPIQELEERARDRFAARGFSEAFCYSMIAAAEDDPFVPQAAAPPLAVVNPIAEPLARLRRSLAAGLVRLADANVRRGADDLRLFEIGRVFRKGAALFPEERPMAAFVWAGSAAPRHWGVPARAVRLPDAAGMMEALLQSVWPRARFRRALPEGPLPAGLHPGKVAVWVASGSAAHFAGALAWTAAIHPQLAQALDLGFEAYLGELDLAALLASEQEPWVVAPVPKVPAVSRDLSLVLPADVEFARVEAAVRREVAPAPARFELLDRYLGPPLEAGEASLTIRVILEPLERTLTDGEVEEYRGRLIGRMRDDLPVRFRE